MNNLIYTYTDAQALTDEVLMNVQSIMPHPINRVTAAVFADYTSDLGGVTDVSQLTVLGELAVKRCVAPEAGLRAFDLTDKTDFDCKTFWLMPNEVKGWTLMYPEDY